MSSIQPPAVVASVLQSGTTQRAAAAPRDGDENLRAAQSRELAGSDKAVEVEIEATDADTRVHADAGGQGGSGRESQEEPVAEAPPPSDAEPDEAGQGHLDLQA